jgi:nitroimidazol reductase NimA-like FMN-containing flavoprotein (pyridoxamine 5'-phosphate oxidase superfamily)
MADTTRTVTEKALTDRGPAPWSLAEQRLADAEPARTWWLATTEADGAPHVMPLIAAWLDGALYFLSGEHTRKGLNLAREPRCVLATGSTTLPSLDLVVEGEAERIVDADDLRRFVEAFGSKLGWPLEVADRGVTGQNAPTAGPPPYAVFRVAPTTVYGLPGMTGMEQFAPDELPRPTRWDVGGSPG